MNSAPVTFANRGEFVAAPEAQARTEMADAVREQMEADQADPTRQQYYRREDKKTVVKTEQEYNQCVAQGIRLTVIPYTTAIHVLKVEGARKRQAKKARQKSKAGRKARRKNS